MILFGYMKNYILKLFSKKNDTTVITNKNLDKIFNRYEKTFKDLALYDKGEKIR